LEAAENEKTFSTFKQDSRYKEILEHTDYECGKFYLDEIKKNKVVYNNIKLFSKNDDYGKPEIFEYKEIGKYSPSSLRYIKVLADLIDRFKCLNNLRIVEIGGGYGGQCLVIKTFFDLKSYKIFDLPEVLLLTDRYLRINHIQSVEFQTLDEFVQSDGIEPWSCDLIISNYAFSEINSKVQMTYLNKIILKSKMGYMTVNEISKLCGVCSLSTHEIVNILRTKGQVIVEPENPLTFKGNKLIWWNWA
jgi:putative sugar O-methyltransferase